MPQEKGLWKTEVPVMETVSSWFFSGMGCPLLPRRLSGEALP